MLKKGLNENGNVIFLLPSIPGPFAGPASTWIPAAGWAQAVAKGGQQAWLVTPLGVMNPEQAFEIATSKRNHRVFTASRRGFLTTVLGTIKKDARDIVRAIRFRNAGLKGPWDHEKVSFVWQRHELFQVCGARAARRFGVPFVLFVDAPVVWESEQWGVKRPGWGSLLEYMVERPSMLNADLICCISETVAEQVRRLGVPDDQILVTPNATDLDHFRPVSNGQSIRERLGLDGLFVIGWVGSFRKFHGLDIVLKAAAKLQVRCTDIAVLMIGEGYEKERIAGMAKDLGIKRIVFTGTVNYSELPRYISAMDVAVLSDSGTSTFHYSPLKLQEYLACGRAVVAPRTGQMSEYLRDGVDSLLVEPGNVPAFVSAIELLYRNSDLRQTMGISARRTALETGGWNKILNDVEDSLRQIDPFRCDAQAG